MTERKFMGSDGKVHSPEDPDYLDAKVVELEATVSQLQKAVVDLQHRMSRLDKEGLQWPGDWHEPTHTKPFDS